MLHTPAQALTALALVCALTGAASAAQSARIECSETQECRRLALDAAGRGAYEAFHDLVWRAIQTGRPNDPDLLFLLARAQSLSNRPHDALVVLGRLADMGMVFDALTHQDLERTRRLPAWPALAARLANVKPKDAAPARAAAPPPAAPPPAAAPSAAPPSAAAIPAPASAPAAAPVAAPAAAVPPAAAAPATPAAAPPAPAPRARAEPAAAASAAAATAISPVKVPLEIGILPADEAMRFAAPGFVAGGLAYDAVSARFILGNVPARALVVVGEGTSRATDLVRSDSTGFADVGGLEIDRRRGDLWVVSTPAGGGGGVLHKLQLISGRNLAAFDVPAASGMVSLVDVAVSAGGTVLVLDGGASRLLRLRPGAKAIEPLAALDGGEPRSVTVSDNERFAYVAAPEGLLRVEMASGSIQPVTAPAGLEVSGIERLRWHRGSLIAVQGLPDGTRRIVRLDLGRNATAVTAATVLHVQDPAVPGPTFATIADDTLYFVSSPGGPADGTDTDGSEIVVRRIALR